MILKDYFEQYKIPESLYQLLLPNFKEIRYESGSTIFNMGEKSRTICLILQGVVRGYYIDEDGNDITKCFSLEGDWCGYYNFLQKGSSPFFVQALEACLLAQIDADILRKVIEANPSLQQIYLKLSENAFVQAEEKGISFQKMNAKERYLLFVKNNPQINQRVKQEYIASYLGITPSSLSRIKRGL